MSAETPLHEHLLAVHAERAASLPGAGVDWVDGLRDRSLAEFARRGLPGPRVEEWRYTRLAAIERRRFAPPSGHSTPVRTLEGTPLAEGGDRPRLVFVDGVPCPALSNSSALPDGVELRELGAALDAGDERLRAALDGIADRARHGFTALNGAFLAHGAWLHVSAGVELSTPIELAHAATAAAADAALQPRVVITLDRGSRATVIESHVALADSAYLANAVTEASLAEGATLEHVRLQNQSTQAFHIDALEVRQARASRFTSRLFALGAALARHDVAASLDGEHAECRLDGLYMTDGRRHVDCHTRIDHVATDCTSREDYRGVLDDRSRGIFDGRITVRPDAQRSDASQNNANLLLSRNAEADAKPQLEIRADDVKCAHGATVGELDPTMLFYLRSRGIAPEAARAMLTVGFTRDLVDRIGDPGLRATVARMVAERLPGGAITREMMA